MHQIVIVMKDSGLQLLENVKFVDTNVQNVLVVLITVLNVMELEHHSMIVHAQLDIMN